MRHKKIKLSALILLGFGLTGLYAQESINVMGGNASGSGGSASFTVGQVFYQAHIGTKGSIAEGIQQPYEIYIVTAIEEAEGIELFVTVYPNPVENILQLRVETSRFNDLSFQLYSMNGRLIESGAILSELFKINMHSLNPAVYFLKIQDSSQKEYKTFKIIKR